MRVGCVYLITNLINGKQYVDQTIHTANHRYKFHCAKNINSAIHKAIVKYGKINFKVEELVSCFSIEAMNEMEESLIATFNTMSPIGYNLISGGKNHFRSAELKNSHSGKMKGKVFESRRKWIRATSLDSKTIYEFKGSKAGIEFGFTPGLVRKCLCGQRFKHAHFTFKYFDHANQNLITVNNNSVAVQRIVNETVEKQNISHQETSTPAA
jgi:hypothetical protein